MDANISVLDPVKARHVEREGRRADDFRQNRRILWRRAVDEHE